MIDRIRIFLLADSHGTVPSLPREVDAALVCGDFSNFEQFYEPLFEALSARGLPIFFTSGNHESPDLCRRIATAYGATCLDYGWVMWHDVLLAGIGGYDIFDLRSREHAVEAFTQKLRELPISPSPKYSLLISHEPPWPWQWGGKVRGQELLRQVLKALKFDLAVVGHWHEVIPRLESEATQIPTINPSSDGCIMEVNIARREFKITAFSDTE